MAPKNDLLEVNSYYIQHLKTSLIHGLSIIRFKKPVSIAMTSEIKQKSIKCAKDPTEYADFKFRIAGLDNFWTFMACQPRALLTTLKK
jgi:hypothetical protein